MKYLIVIDEFNSAGFDKDLRKGIKPSDSLGIRASRNIDDVYSYLERIGLGALKVQHDRVSKMATAKMAEKEKCDNNYHTMVRAYKASHPGTDRYDVEYEHAKVMVDVFADILDEYIGKAYESVTADEIKAAEEYARQKSETREKITSRKLKLERELEELRRVEAYLDSLDDMRSSW